MNKLFLFFILFFALNIKAQEEFGLGLLLDDSLYSDRPVAAPLMRGDYADLPESASLKQFTPTPGSQGPYGTCAGWSTAYSARTILEALKNNWQGTIIDSNSFSPSFVYNQIRISNDCKGGTSLIDALNVLKDFGGLKFNEFGYDCSRDVTTQDKSKASVYRIIEYRDLIASNVVQKSRFVKKSLAEGRPVVIAMDCPYSLGRAKEVWIPDSSDYKDWGRGHAITVIGYDDKKFGGAFELMNSWGKSWGKGGFVWMKYSDFDFFCKYAFEVIDKSATESALPDLSGTLSFETSSGEEMKSTFNGNYFVTDNTYPSGTLFELRISNNEPAYVYSFSSDLTYKTYKIFPFTKTMLAYLPYRQNNIAIPDEESYNLLDQTTGSSYYCFLYSKRAFDIDSIMITVESENGTFWERITHVLGEDIVDKKNIEYKSDNSISFSAFSEDKSVVPVLVEIKHF